MVGDRVSAELGAVRAGADLDHGHHLLEASAHFGVALENETIREKRRLIGAQAQLGEGVGHLYGRHHGDSERDSARAVAERQASSRPSCRRSRPPHEQRGHDVPRGVETTVESNGS
jgi:hypothetical protein